MVRYYHRTGVLPEPPRTASGYRDYQLSDVALLLKLRTLTDAGIPAASLHGVLTKDATVPADIVQDALDNVDEEITRLQHQRARLVAMQEGASGIPADIRELIADLQRWVTDRDGDGTLAELLDQDLQGLQLMADAGVATPETWELLRRTLVDERRRSATLEGLAAWSALAGYPESSESSESSGSSDVSGSTAVAQLREAMIRSVDDGVLGGLPDTLVDGDVPLATTDIPTTGAQAAVLTDLVKHMESGRRSR